MSTGESSRVASCQNENERLVWLRIEPLRCTRSYVANDETVTTCRRALS
jgi:hypothetical protein